MLRWAAFFFVLVLVSAVLAFTTVLGAAFALAKVFFFIFVTLFLVTVVAGLFLVKKVTKKK